MLVCWSVTCAYVCLCVCVFVSVCVCVCARMRVCVYVCIGLWPCAHERKPARVPDGISRQSIMQITCL